MAIFEMVKYHTQAYPTDIPLRAEECAAHFDITSVKADLRYSLHTEYSYGKRKFDSELVNRFPSVVSAQKDGVPQLWKDESWAAEFAQFIFALAGDDLHYPDRSNRIAVRCSFLCCPSAGYSDILETLRDGCYYSMRIPDYGKGDWETKYERNRAVPHVTGIGLDRDTVFIYLSHKADSIKFTGQNHATLMMASGTDYAAYRMKDSDPYARVTAYFPDGEVIYSNVFARYDASMADSPFRAPSHTVNIPLTIIFNISLLFLCGLLIYLIYRLFKRK